MKKNACFECDHVFKNTTTLIGTLAWAIYIYPLFKPQTTLLINHLR
jgi:hypothetical protein